MRMITLISESTEQEANMRSDRGFTLQDEKSIAATTDKGLHFGTHKEIRGYAKTNNMEAVTWSLNSWVLTYDCAVF